MQPPAATDMKTGLYAAACAWILALAVESAGAQTTTITVATFPDLDRAAKAALPRWKQQYPQVDVKIVSLQYSDHHTAMTTALATGSGLPDVMAIDFRFIGQVRRQSGGFDDLLKPSRTMPRPLLAVASCAFTYPAGDEPAKGQLVGAAGRHRPPGTLLYRHGPGANSAGLSQKPT